MPTSTLAEAACSCLSPKPSGLASRQVLEGLVALVGGDGSQGRHRVQDVGVAPLERLAGVLAVGGVEAGGVVDDAGQDRSLAQVQALGRLVEEGPGGGLHAVRAATEVDGVEVVGQQLGLGDLALELQGQDGLLELALVGLLLAEVEDLDVLLGDRGGTLAVTARGVVEHRAQDALDVDAGVGPEGLVLGGDHRVLDRVGHLVVGDDRTVLRGERAELGLAVGVVDARGLGLEVLVGARDVDGAVEVEERRTRDEGQHEPRDRGPLQGPQAALLPGAGLLGPGCRALPHRRAGSPALACHVPVSPLLLGVGTWWSQPREGWTATEGYATGTRGTGCRRRGCPPPGRGEQWRTSRYHAGSHCVDISLRCISWHVAERPSSSQSSDCCTRDPCTATSCASAST